MAWKQWWVVRAEEGGGDGGGAQGGVESQETPAAPPSDRSGESTSDPAEHEESGGEASPKQPSESKGKERLNKRFSELTRTIYDERARREEAEREVAELRSRFERGDGGAAREDKEPKLADFKEYEEYADARSRWVARQELRRATAAAREASSREAAMQRAAEIRSRWESSESQAREKFDDYDEVMAGPVRFPESVAVALLDSEHGPEISYYLKTHPDEAKALRGLTPVAAARVVGKLEAKLSAEPPKKEQSNAPPPPKPARAQAPSDGLRNDLSDSEWIRRRNKQELDRRRNG